MLDADFIQQLLDRMATSITASAVRKQGPKGTKDTVQDFLCQPRLIERFSKAKDRDTFAKALDCETEALQKTLQQIKPQPGQQYGQQWGIARKCLNIFLFECFLNRYLYAHYNLGNWKEWLEVPLDSLVGQGLRKDAKSFDIVAPPAWNTIKDLCPEESEKYQNAAISIARKRNTSRVFLELIYWRRVKESESL
jgi:hypothetical protein